MYRRIVVPLDGSKLAETALSQAIDLARLTGAPVHLLRVVDFRRLDQYGPYALALEYAGDPVLADEHALALAYVRDVRSRLDGMGLYANTEVREGRIAREVVAALKPGDIVVMASHGRGGFSRWLLGSVAEDVVRHAAVPVLLVKADAASVPAEDSLPAAVAVTS
jgi:nucleotide-binding universal stress UspA family protein